MDSVTFKPKQKRSEQSLKKIIDAMMRLVEDKYFEKITILEIVNEANLSAGTFYRRFKSKEDALPVIYEQFQKDLRSWLEQKSIEWQQLKLEQLVKDMTQSIFEFVLAKKGIFRTLYLNARLNEKVLPAEILAQRTSDFNQLASFYARFNLGKKDHSRQAAQFAIFTMVNNAIEKCVYPQITPASGCPHNLQESIDATASMLTVYLKTEFAF